MRCLTTKVDVPADLDEEKCFNVLNIRNKKVLSQYSEGADLSGPTRVLYIANRPPSSSVRYTMIV